MAAQPNGTFAEHLSFYFTASGITDGDKQRAILLSACGTTTYKLLKTLVASAEVTSKSFSDLVKEHHNPKPSIILRRFRFNTCVRQEGESITAYVKRLRNLASHCEYGDSTKELIRDRLVCGVRDDALQRALFAVAKLTFDKAFELALLHESAAQNARLLSDPSFTTPVHFADPPGLYRKTHRQETQSDATVVEEATTRRTAVSRTPCVITVTKKDTFNARGGHQSRDPLALDNPAAAGCRRSDGPSRAPSLGRRAIASSSGLVADRGRRVGRACRFSCRKSYNFQRWTPRLVHR